MKLEARDEAEVSVLMLFGDLDDAGIRVLRDTLHMTMTIRGRYRLVVNVANLRFLSYPAVGVLVNTTRRARALDGDMKLAGANLYTQRLLKFTGMTGFFELFETDEQAIAAYGERAL